MLRRWADVTARTTTSVSTVRMGILSYSCVTASTTRSRIRVSAYLRVHGARPNMYRGTSVCYVLTTYLPVAMVAALAGHHGKYFGEVGIPAFITF